MIQNPAKRATSGRKRNAFTMPAMSRAKQNDLAKNGRVSHTLLSMASDERLREATPSLKAMYAWLEKDRA